jgi:proteasome lid subunit RPN8/RPN11
MAEKFTECAIVERGEPLARTLARRLGGGYVLPSHERKRLHRRARLRQRQDQGEVCGVLLMTRARCLELIFIDNLSRSPGQFELSAGAVAMVRRGTQARKERLIGFFHSHPISPAVPSGGDIRKAPLRSFHLIYDVCGCEPRLWYYTRRSRRPVAIELPLEVQK